VNRFLGLALFVLAVAAACGGGSGNRLSHAQLVQRADAICTTFNQQLKALAQPTTPLEVGPFIKKAVPLERGALESLKKLKPAKGDETDFKLFVAQIQRETTLAQDELVPATQSPTNAKHVQFILAKLSALDAQANAIAKKIGLTVCGRTATG
jgi:hypothetical protein